MHSKLSLLGLSGILLCWPANAQTIAQTFAQPIFSNSTEDSACYFKTTQGFVMDLNSICGASQPKTPEKRPQNSTNSQIITPSPITPNPEFRPIAGANPSNPFGRNPATNNQCYIVDSNGDRCDP
jgi:hypothetical protein